MHFFLARFCRSIQTSVALPVLTVFILFCLFAAPNLLPMAQPATTAPLRPTITPTETTVSADMLLITTTLTATRPCPTVLTQTTDTKLKDVATQRSANYLKLDQIVADEAAAQALIESRNAAVVIWGSCADGALQLNYTLNAHMLDTIAQTRWVTAKTRDEDKLKAYAGISMRLLKNRINNKQAAEYAMLFVSAQLAYLSQDFDAALDDLNATIELGEQLDSFTLGDTSKSQLDSAYFLRGYVYQEVHNNAYGSLADYNHVIELNPQDAHAYNNRCIVKRAMGDFDGALPDCDRAIELNPQSARMYFNRANLKRDLLDYRSALADYDRAIDLDPQFMLAYNNRGATKNDLGDVRGALEDFERAVEIDPHYSFGYSNLAYAKAQLGDLQGALAAYDRAIEVDPTNASAYYQRSYIKIQSGDYQGAVEDLDQYLLLKPDDADGYYNRGTLKYQRGDYQGAIDDLTHAIDLNPYYFAAYINRGNARYELGYFQGSIDDFTHAIELSPYSSMAYTNRAISEEANGDYQAAIDDCTFALQIDPRYAVAYYTRGLSYQRLSNYDAALADYYEYLALEPGDRRGAQARIVEIQSILSRTPEATMRPRPTSEMPAFRPSPTFPPTRTPKP